MRHQLPVALLTLALSVTSAGAQVIPSLHEALLSGNDKQAKKLINERSAKKIYFGLSTLHIACGSYQISPLTVQRLLELGANPHARAPRSIGTAISVIVGADPKKVTSAMLKDIFLPKVKLLLDHGPLVSEDDVTESLLLEYHLSTAEGPTGGQMSELLARRLENSQLGRPFKKSTEK